MATADLGQEPSREMEALASHLLRLAKDPTNTEEVFKIADTFRANLTPPQVEAISALFLRDPDFEELYESGNRDLIEKPYDLEALAQLPANTLGGRFGRHMNDRGLSPEFFPYLEVTEAVTYLGMRIRKTHDIWHVLAGFDTDPAGEVGLMGFYQAQYPSSFPMAIMVATMLGAIERRDLAEIDDVMVQTCAGFQNGKRARKLYGVVWEDHWERDLAEVRKEFSIEPFRA